MQKKSNKCNVFGPLDCFCCCCCCCWRKNRDTASLEHGPPSNQGYWSSGILLVCSIARAPVAPFWLDLCILPPTMRSSQLQDSVYIKNAFYCRSVIVHLLVLVSQSEFENSAIWLDSTILTLGTGCCRNLWKSWYRSFQVRWRKQLQSSNSLMLV